MELNLFNEILNDLKGSGELRSTFVKSYKDVRGTNVGKVARNKGLKANAAINKAAQIADRYGRKVDLQTYRSIRRKAKIELKQARRAIYNHFLDSRWTETADGLPRCTAMDEMSIANKPLYLAWLKRVNDYHSLILETLEKTYIVRIK